MLDKERIKKLLLLKIMDTLVFGTDGWRDVIADKFTFINLARATQAYADYLISQEQHTVVVGHDTRFLGYQFARHAAEILAANGLKVFLSESYLPTPALSYAVKYYGAGVALCSRPHITHRNITALS